MNNAATNQTMNRANYDYVIQSLSPEYAQIGAAHWNLMVGTGAIELIESLIEAGKLDDFAVSVYETCRKHRRSSVKQATVLAVAVSKATADTAEEDAARVKKSDDERNASKRASRKRRADRKKIETVKFEKDTRKSDAVWEALTIGQSVDHVLKGAAVVTGKNETHVTFALDNGQTMRVAKKFADILTIKN